MHNTECQAAFGIRRVANDRMLRVQQHHLENLMTQVSQCWMVVLEWLSAEPIFMPLDSGEARERLPSSIAALIWAAFASPTPGTEQSSSMPQRANLTLLRDNPGLP